jgi:hypothetical protein
MPRDLHGQDPVLGYSHGNDPVTGSTTTEASDARKAGIVLTGLALNEVDGDAERVDRGELDDLMQMIGLKSAA